MNTNKSYTSRVMQMIGEACNLQTKYSIDVVTTELLLGGLLSIDCVASRILSKYGVTLTKVMNRILETSNIAPKQKVMSAKANSVLTVASNYSVKTNCDFVATEHVLYAMLISTETVAHAILFEYASDFELLKQEVHEAVLSLGKNFVAENTQTETKPRNQQSVETAVLDRPQKPARQNRATSTYNPSFVLEESPLAGFGYDLTKKALNGEIDPVIGRDKEIARVVQTLSRRLKNNPLLIGEPGIGKSAVVEGLAQRIVEGKVPLTLANKVIVAMDLSSIVAGSKYRGEFEERFKSAIELAKENKDIILFIDEIHNITGVGSSADLKATEIIKPSLARGELKLIGATTIDEYRKYIEKDSALERRFQTIKLEPPSVEDCIEIIKGLRDNFEAHHQVRILDEAIVAAVTLSDRYITDRFLPDKAIDLIDEAAAHKRMLLCTPEDEVITKQEELERLQNELTYARRQNRAVKRIEEKIEQLNQELDELYKLELEKRSDEGQFIDADDISAIISDLTNIPIARLSETEADRLLKIEEELHKRVIGQNDAVSAVSKAIRRARACVKDGARPIGSFIFVGPTGVGKTELAKALAESVFGDDRQLIRLDMSEYMEKASVAKLIGAPPGYVGYDEEGQLTGKVRLKPYSVVLFDEIEKAHPDVFNLMLQILDDGRLTDSKGKLVDFKNTIIILTSNLGAQEAHDKKAFGFGTVKTDDVKNVMFDALKKRFKPEFLNRIDDIIVFERLSKDECGQICDILCEKLIKRLRGQDVELYIMQSAKDFLLEKGYDEEFGARPLRRTIQKYLEDAISEKIIAGEIERGDKVTAVKDGDEIRFIK